MYRWKRLDSPGQLAGPGCCAAPSEIASIGEEFPLAGRKCTKENLVPLLNPALRLLCAVPDWAVTRIQPARSSALSEHIPYVLPTSGRCRPFRGRIASERGLL